MSESEQERTAREDLATEELGQKWQRKKDEYLVGYVAEQRAHRQHTPAIVEMQRRVMLTYQQGSREAAAQTATVIRLTRQLKWYTVAIFFVAVVQAAATVAQVIAMFRR